jgi:hypothetical protein
LTSCGGSFVRREPPRPSARLTTLGRLGTTDGVQRRAPLRLAALAVHGDLDWIVMKALEKDRTRRYETAAELAADVQRHLNQKPVAARPPPRPASGTRTVSYRPSRNRVLRRWIGSLPGRPPGSGSCLSREIGVTASSVAAARLGQLQQRALEAIQLP